MLYEAENENNADTPGWIACKSGGYCEEYSLSKFDEELNSRVVNSGSNSAKCSKILQERYLEEVKKFEQVF